MKMACEKTIYLYENVQAIRIIILEPKHIPSRNASTERLRSIDWKSINLYNIAGLLNMIKFMKFVYCLAS